MVSSIVISLTYTGANLLSNALSLLIYLRYSAVVVAPIQRTSPRASAGFNKFAASAPPY